MALSLSPASSQLFQTYQDVSASGTVSAVGNTGDVSWTYGVSPENLADLITFNEGATSLGINYTADPTLWEVEVTYIDNLMVSHTVNNWDSVPETNRDLYSVTPEVPNTKTITVSVTGEDDMGSASGTYTILIKANYSINHAPLLARI